MEYRTTSVSMLSPLAQGCGSWDGGLIDINSETYQQASHSLPALHRLPDEGTHRHGITVSPRVSTTPISPRCPPTPPVRNLVDGSLILPKTYTTRKGALVLFTQGGGEIVVSAKHRKRLREHLGLKPDFVLDLPTNLANIPWFDDFSYTLGNDKVDDASDFAEIDQFGFTKREDDYSTRTYPRPGSDVPSCLRHLRVSSGKLDCNRARSAIGATRKIRSGMQAYPDLSRWLDPDFDLDTESFVEQVKRAPSAPAKFTDRSSTFFASSGRPAHSYPVLSSDKLLASLRSVHSYMGRATPTPTAMDYELRNREVFHPGHVRFHKRLPSPKFPATPRSFGRPASAGKLGRSYVDSRYLFPESCIDAHLDSHLDLLDSRFELLDYQLDSARESDGHNGTPITSDHGSSVPSMHLSRSLTNLFSPKIHNIEESNEFIQISSRRPWKYNPMINMLDTIYRTGQDSFPQIKSMGDGRGAHGSKTSTKRHTICKMQAVVLKEDKANKQDFVDKLPSAGSRDIGGKALSEYSEKRLEIQLTNLAFDEDQDFTSTERGSDEAFESGSQAIGSSEAQLHEANSEPSFRSQIETLPSVSFKSGRPTTSNTQFKDDHVEIHDKESTNVLREGQTQEELNQLDANLIDSKHLVKQELDSKDLATHDLSTGTEPTKELATGGLSPDELATGGLSPGELVTGELVNGEMTTGKLATGTLVTGELVNGELTTGKLATGTLVTGELATQELDIAQLTGGEVSSAGELVKEGLIRERQIMGDLAGEDVVTKEGRASIVEATEAGMLPAKEGAMTAANEYAAPSAKEDVLPKVVDADGKPIESAIRDAKPAPSKTDVGEVFIPLEGSEPQKVDSDATLPRESSISEGRESSVGQESESSRSPKSTISPKSPYLPMLDDDEEIDSFCLDPKNLTMRAKSKSATAFPEVQAFPLGKSRTRRYTTPGIVFTSSSKEAVNIQRSTPDISASPSYTTFVEKKEEHVRSKPSKMSISPITSIAESRQETVIIETPKTTVKVKSPQIVISTRPSKQSPVAEAPKPVPRPVAEAPKPVRSPKTQKVSSGLSPTRHQATVKPQSPVQRRPIKTFPKPERRGSVAGLKDKKAKKKKHSQPELPSASVKEEEDDTSKAGKVTRKDKKKKKKKMEVTPESTVEVKEVEDPEKQYKQAQLDEVKKMQERIKQQTDHNLLKLQSITERRQALEQDLAEVSRAAREVRHEKEMLDFFSIKEEKAEKRKLHLEARKAEAHRKRQQAKEDRRKTERERRKVESMKTLKETLEAESVSEVHMEEQLQLEEERHGKIDKEEKEEAEREFQRLKAIEIQRKEMARKAKDEMRVDALKIAKEEMVRMEEVSQLKKLEEAQKMELENQKRMEEDARKKEALRMIEEEEERKKAVQRAEEEAARIEHQRAEAEARREYLLRRREENVERRANLLGMRQSQNVNHAWTFSYHVMWPRETFQNMGADEPKRKNVKFNKKGKI